jgi:hypothetical protein
MCKLAYDHEKEAKERYSFFPWKVAEKKCQRSLDSCEKVLGLNHPMTLDMANFHGRLLASQNQLVEGGTPHRRSPNDGKNTSSHDLLDTQNIMEECWDMEEARQHSTRLVPKS